MYMCLFTYIHLWVRVHVNTHMHAFLSGYVLTHIPVSIHREHTAHTRIHTHTHTHRLTRHTYTPHDRRDTSSEKREVDSLHHEK